ncbi:MAG: 2-phospho-L-lactate guanylyltransferase [Anaerolineales bacterium]
MSLWAIVPVKPLRRGKSRLAEVLTEEQRIELNQRMLAQTVDILHKVKGVENVLVVSRDPEALSVAREHDARTLLENGNPNLNVALTRASVVAKAYGVHGVLIVPADLPLMEPDDIQKMIELGNSNPCVVIAPDRHCEGTNALLVAPPDLMKFDYGSGSFERHCKRARQADARLEVYEIDSLALDVDWPEDLDLLSKSLRVEIGVMELSWD